MSDQNQQPSLANLEPGTITLLRRAESGDPTARNDLFRRFFKPGGYYDQMMIWVRGSTLAEDAEDIVQKALMAFFNRLTVGSTTAIQDRDRLRGLLYCITQRRAVNEIRSRTATKRETSRTQPLPTNSDGEDLLADSRSDPMLQTSLHELIEHLLAALPENLRPAAELVLEGRSLAEMTVALRKSSSTIERARRDIKGRFESVLRELRREEEQLESGASSF